MSFELIDNIEEKYPEEYFTIGSVYRENIVSILDRIRDKLKDLETRIKTLEG